MLLELAHVLSQAISETEQIISDMHGGIGTRAADTEVWRNLDEKIDYALSVYKSLMGQELLREIQTSKENNERISFEVEHEDLDILSAYELSLKNHRELFTSLSGFKTKLSGVNT